jgi:hypothetical protein
VDHGCACAEKVERGTELRSLVVSYAIEEPVERTALILPELGWIVDELGQIGPVDSARANPVVVFVQLVVLYLMCDGRRCDELDCDHVSEHRIGAVLVGPIVFRNRTCRARAHWSYPGSRSTRPFLAGDAAPHQLPRVGEADDLLHVARHRHHPPRRRPVRIMISV